MPFLKEFFAVTTTSLYHVTWYKSIRQVVAKKIDLIGESEIPIGARLMGGYFLGISTNYLVQYGTERVPPEKADKDTWGNATSPIVGLFLRKEEAEACLRSGSLSKLDLRWRQQTEETVAAIGSNHPAFVFSEIDPISYD